MKRLTVPETISPARAAELQAIADTMQEVWNLRGAEKNFTQSMIEEDRFFQPFYSRLTKAR